MSTAVEMPLFNFLLLPKSQHVGFHPGCSVHWHSARPDTVEAKMRRRRGTSPPYRTLEIRKHQRLLTRALLQCFSDFKRR